MNKTIDESLLSDFFEIEDGEVLDDSIIPQMAAEWEHFGMPDRLQKNELDLMSSTVVKFRNKEDMKEFSKLVGTKITPLTKSIWFPVRQQNQVGCMRWVDDDEE